MPLKVILKAPADDWFMLGGLSDFDKDKVVTEDDGKTFFYQKWQVGCHLNSSFVLTVGFFCMHLCLTLN